MKKENTKKKVVSVPIISDFEYKLFSLPKKEVRVIAKYMEREGKALLEIVGKNIRHQCPKCGSYKTKRLGTGFEEHIVNHMFLSNYCVLQLRIFKRRFVCLDCEEKKKGGDGSGGESTFLERFSFLEPGCDNTETFKSLVLQEWGTQSISELARKFFISESLIYRMIRDVSLETLVQSKITFLSKLDEIYLGIDEFSFRGQDYICQITELKTRRVIGILKTNSKQELLSWLKLLPLEVLHKIKAVASDMNNTYKSTIEEFIYQAIQKTIPEVQRKSLGVADHYHLKQLFSKLILEVYGMNNWMIKAGHYDKMIRDICTLETKNFNKYREDRLEFNVRGFREYRPKSEDYKPITLGYFLSKRYCDLLQLNQKKLTVKQAHRLNQILFEFDPKGYLRDAYLAKELFNEAIETKDISLIEKVINNLKSSLHYKVKICGETLERWKAEIINFFKTNLTNAFTEGKNTKAKLLKRMAYGYKIKENYMKRLLLCL